MDDATSDEEAPGPNDSSAHDAPGPNDATAPPAPGPNDSIAHDAPGPNDATAPPTPGPTDTGLTPTVVGLLAERLVTLEQRQLLIEDGWRVIIEDGLRAIWERLDSVDRGLVAVQANLVGAPGETSKAERSSDAVALLRQIAAESDAAPAPVLPAGAGGRHFRGGGTA